GSTGGAVALGFHANFFGTDYQSLYVNNNGNVTFDSQLSDYTPFDLSSSGLAIIAPFFADVDTRNSASGQLHYGATTFAGHAAFCALWSDVAADGTPKGVGYYNVKVDKL